jgi:hypothetical protein
MVAWAVGLALLARLWRELARSWILAGKQAEKDLGLMLSTEDGLEHAKLGARRW